MLHVFLAAALRRAPTLPCGGPGRGSSVHAQSAADRRGARTPSAGARGCDVRSLRTGTLRVLAGDRWPEIRFGVYGNSTFADCTLAAVADLEQIEERADTPLVAASKQASASDPFVATYLTMTDGSPTAGVPVTTVLDSWVQAPINGLQITGYASVPTDRASIRAELAGGTPLYAWFYLPHPRGRRPTLPTAPWTARDAPVDPESAATHVGVIVGATSRYVDVETWGRLQKISWQWWSTWSLGAWSVEF